MNRIEKVKAVMKEGSNKIALLNDEDIEWLIQVAEAAKGVLDFVNPMFCDDDPPLKKLQEVFKK